MRVPVVVAIAVSAFSPSVRADDTLTLPQVLAAAVRQSPDLERASIDLKAAEAALLKAKGIEDTHLGAAGEGVRYATTIDNEKSVSTSGEWLGVRHEGAPDRHRRRPQRQHVLLRHAGWIRSSTASSSMRLTSARRPSRSPNRCCVVAGQRVRSADSRRRTLARCRDPRTRGQGPRLDRPDRRSVLASLARARISRRAQGEPRSREAAARDHRSADPQRQGRDAARRSPSSR